VIVSRLNAEIGRILKTPDLKQRYQACMLGK
jgi:hypothetical protein